MCQQPFNEVTRYRLTRHHRSQAVGRGLTQVCWCMQRISRLLRDGIWEVGSLGRQILIFRASTHHHPLTPHHSPPPGTFLFTLSFGLSVHS